MTKRTGPTDVHLRQMVEELKKKSHELNAPIWGEVAHQLEKSRRRMVEVNLSKIEKYTVEGGFVIVPGKVLGTGELKKAVNIAAWRFSQSALEKIKQTKGKILTISDLLKEKPKGTDVKILV